MNRIILIFCYIFFCISIVTAQSPYIEKVFDYSPAPGQFVNTMPEYTDGDTHETMTQKADFAISHNNRSMICLGGFGGSVTFGFDHEIVNHPGEYDFQILGNAVLSVNSEDGKVGGSSEPGIILVASDENGNGLPDDTWYEIAGSEYYKPETKHSYTITYYRTPDNHRPTPDPDNKVLTDTSYIAWKGSDGNTGFIAKNSFHSQDYYPQWIKSDSIQITGTLLPDNAKWHADKNMYVLYCYDYGYADNYPNNSEQSKINIDWAVNESGEPANLSSIKFVKIYTAVNQQCGWIGETSTEVMGAVDLHIVDAVNILNESDKTTIHAIYNIQGQQISTPIEHLEHGFYIVSYRNGTTRKIIR